MKAKTLLASLSLALLLAACDDKPKAQAEPSENKETAMENLPENNKDSTVNADTVSNPEGEVKCDQDIEEQENIVDILFPFEYDFERDHTKKINNGWVSLIKDSTDNSYYIKQAEFSIELGEACNDSAKLLKSKDDVILFMDLPDIKKGKIKHVNFAQSYSQSHIWPGDTLRFEFNGAQYSLRATGNVLDTVYGTHVKDYKLYIRTDGKPEELLLDIENFEDNFMRLLFIGDIDGDGTPDFVFDASWHYEVAIRVLFLSTMAEEGKITKEVARLAIGFGC